MSYHKGWDIFCVDQGKTPITEDCKVCGTKLDVNLGETGPRSFNDAVRKISRTFDQYTCPHAGTNWHDQAYALRKAAEETPSRKLELYYLMEADEVVASQMHTKKVNPYSC